MYFFPPHNHFEAQTISPNSKLFHKSVTIALSIWITEPQLNWCSNFIVRSLVTSSKTVLRFANETKTWRYQIEAICWVIQESNTKAPNPCSCFRICVGSSIVLLKDNAPCKGQNPRSRPFGFPQCSTIPFTVNDCASQHEYWMHHDCINRPDNLSITLPADVHSDVYAILSTKKKKNFHLFKYVYRRYGSETLWQDSISSA